LRFKQRTVLAIHRADAWLHAKAAADAFDAANADATVPNREARRLISYSQEGAGAWLARRPDDAVLGSKVPDSDFLLRIQRRAGLYLTALTAALHHATTLGLAVSEHARLGDASINEANATHRHNAALNCIHHALAAVTDTRAPAAAYMRGDKGDGTPAGREDAKRRWAWANATHIPDIVRTSTPPVCYEVKCGSPFIIGGLKGVNSHEHCGVPSQVEGHVFAFGCTLEQFTRQVLGLRAVGSASDEPFNRRSGAGRIHVHHGEYADALRRGHSTLLLATESSGAMNPVLVGLLRILGRIAKQPTSNDLTVYGTSSASPRAFALHHAAAICSAILKADSDAVLNDASARLVHLSLSPPPPLPLPPPLPPPPPPPPPPPAAAADGRARQLLLLLLPPPP
jgi:hypothetical protein